MRFIRAVCVVPVLGLLLAAAEAQKDDPRSPKGVWTIVAVKSMGRAAPDDLLKDLTVTFDGQNYTNKAKNEVVEQGTYQVDTAKTPWTIDFAIKKGPDAGKRQLGLFTIEGETLTLSVSDPGTETRPTTLESKADTPGMIYVMMRAIKEPGK